MFRLRGKSRNLKQNLGIASLLSFVAGIVNVVGFLSVQNLTTNVTGHFAFMIDEATKLNVSQAFFFFTYIFFFFLGAFFSNFIVEFTDSVTERHRFILPVLTEAFILTLVACLDIDYITHHPNLIACVLLFAMGLQNAMVTKISQSVVRTTHLTGLFTDLGIEVSQLFFIQSKEEKSKIYASIQLRLTIIVAFFLGGVLAGISFSYFQTQTLFIAAGALFTGLIIDYFVIILNFTRLKARRNHHQG